MGRRDAGPTIIAIEISGGGDARSWLGRRRRDGGRWRLVLCRLRLLRREDAGGCRLLWPSRKRFGSGAFDLDLSDRRIDLLEEGFDLAIRIGSLEDSTLVAKRLTRIRHVPCVSPSLLETLGLPDRPEDLASFPALTYRSRAGRARWRFRRPDGSQGTITPDARLWASNGDMLCKQAVAGLGIIVEPTLIAAPYLLDGRLVPLFADHAWSEDAAFAIYPKADALPRRVRAIIDHFAAALTMDPPWDRQLREALTDHEWDTR